MYDWYSEAAEYIIYMANVDSMAADSSDETWAAFQESEWFDRGWTLQELLASQVKVFCTSKWEVLGHIDNTNEEYGWPRRLPEGCLGALSFRSSVPRDSSDFEKYYKADVASLVSQVTGIQQRYLEGVDPIHNASIACRMSWASRRRTTRSEDMAYCLLGLFDVNMPLLYGEGCKSFFRLQEEIMRHSDDQSIFAWSNVLGGPRFSSLLAPDVRNFHHSCHIGRSEARPDFPYSITNIGLHLRIKLQQPSVDLQDPLCLIHFTRLNCVSEGNNCSTRLFLLQCSHDPRKEWTRSMANDLFIDGVVSDELQIRSTETKYEPTYTEIFALLRDPQGDTCNLCIDSDRRFCSHLALTADRQGMLKATIRM